MMSDHNRVDVMSALYDAYLQTNPNLKIARSNIAKARAAVFELIAAAEILDEKGTASESSDFDRLSIALARAQGRAT